MASEKEFTSDSLDTTETDLPEALLDYVRDQVVDCIKQTKFSAKIQHAQGQSPKLLLSFGNLNEQKQSSADTKNTDTILVENLPSTADEDLLEVFFESKKKYGGGPVKDVKLIRDKNIAFVKFSEANAVDLVLKKKPIMLGTTELFVKPFKPLLTDNKAIIRAGVIRLQVPKDFTDGLLKRYLNPISTYGPELAAMMKVGIKVVRGKDWKWQNQDDGTEGVVIDLKPDGKPGWVKVEWKNGFKYIYRMGAEDSYDLQLAPVS